MYYASTEYFDALMGIMKQYLSFHYDYCYLSAMHEKNKKEGANTIIVGSSHAMNGLLEREMEKGGWGYTINFSISSQDLWFDFQHIKKALREGRRKISRCIINFGYYMLYQDLSMSETMKYLLPTVYAPIFGTANMRHMDVPAIPDFMEMIEYDKEMFPARIIRPLCEYWSKAALYEQSSYYGSLVSRESVNLMGVKKVMWSTLDDAQKREVALERATAHNKHIKREKSRRENGEIVREMIRFLTEHEVKPLILITPYTRYYNEFINPVYKKDIFDLLDSVPDPVDFLDMNDYPDAFSDEDFLDSDHLNLTGAERTTAFLNSYLEMITAEERSNDEEDDEANC